MELRRACAQFEDQLVLGHLGLKIDRGEWVALVGANGCGKSTLLHALSGGLRIQGELLLDGSSIVSTPRRLVAQRVALLLQQLPRIPGMAVCQLVAHGRFPQRSMRAMLCDLFDERCAVTLAKAGTTHLGNQMVDSLSGGKRQRVRLALSLIQDVSTLLLDELVTFPDIYRQLEVLDLIVRLRRVHGLTAIPVLHDLEHVACYTDRLVTLSRERIVADDDLAAMMIPQLLEEVFVIIGRIGTDEYIGRLVMHTNSPRERFP